MLFTRQLATLLKAGIPMLDALGRAGTGKVRPGMRRVALGVKARATRGELAAAFAAYPQCFDSLYVAVVRTGEVGGRLDQALDGLARYLENREILKGKIRRAMIYPALVLGSVVVLVGFLLTYVIPVFAAFFAGFGADLPAFSRGVFDLSQWALDHWYLLVGLPLAAAMGVVSLRRSNAGFRLATDRIALGLPLLGSLFDLAANARFTRALAFLYDAGVILSQALHWAADVTGNGVYRGAILALRDRVAAGDTLTRALQTSDRFPSLVIQMVDTGETTGQLGATLHRVADYYDSELAGRIEVMISLLQPLLMAILAVIVGSLVIAFYLALFQLADVV